jgi:hypothetical protein
VEGSLENISPNPQPHGKILSAKALAETSLYLNPSSDGRSMPLWLRSKNYPLIIEKPSLRD